MNQPGAPTPSGLSSPRSYKPALYVQRDEEGPVHNTIDILKDSGHTSPPSIFYFWGSSGLGKTFFLKHFQDFYTTDQKAGPDSSLLTLFYGFDRRSPDVLEDLTGELVRQAAGVLPAAKITSFAALTQHLVEMARDRSTPALLLLLDNIDELSEEQQEIWQKIETQLVEPLITRRCVVVSTGSRHNPRWSRYEIRRRLNDESQQTLSPFKLPQVIEQIQKAGYELSASICKTIYELSGGIPGLVDSFAKHFSGWIQAGKQINRDTKSLDWYKKMNDILSNSEQTLVPEEQVRKDLEILFPLRSFRVETLRYMLSSYRTELTGRPDVFFLDYIRKLDKRTDVIWYDSSRRAYVTSPAVRKLIDQRSLLKSRIDNSPSYWELHDTAARMYWEWAKDTPKVSEDYLLEIIYHRARQHHAKRDSDWLIKALDEVLDFARRNLHARRLNGLRATLLGDEEIRTLLPESAWEYVEKALEDGPRAAVSQEPGSAPTIS